MTDTDERHSDSEGIVGWETDEARTESVDDDRCVWCKWPREEWADDVDGHELDTGEVVCSNCLGDQRVYKRLAVVQLYRPRAWFDPETNDAISEKYTELLEIADGTEEAVRKSNATGLAGYDDE